MVAATVQAMLAVAARGASAQDRFAATDAYADAAPSSVEQSVPALAAYLARSGPDDLTRTRAVYRWVTRHIDYDVPGFRSGNYGDFTPEAVLRRRLSVCEGYSRLTQALGTAMGLQVEVVKGWSKGYSYASGDRINGPINHSWNAVRIDGRWRLMDPTWGGGYLDERGQYVREFQEHYFLTAPDRFAFDHLPADPRWQLLERPLSMAEFADRVYVRPMFFQTGFSIRSNPHARIATGDRVTVTLGVSQPVAMIAEVVDPLTDRPLTGEHAFVQVNDVQAEIRAAFPRAGDYVIRLFAKSRGAPGDLEWILDYRVKASRGTNDATFPEAYRSFGTSGAWLLDTPGGVLDVGRTYHFRLRAPGAVDVMLVSGGQRTTLARAGDEFSADVSAQPGEAVIYAKYGAASGYLGLLKYVGH
jgi:hypothetical protein